ISYSRNRGNDAARGKYIMVMDQDDDNHPDRIKKQVAYMESQPWVTVSVVPARLYGWPVDATWIEDDIKLSLFFHNTIGHPNIMVKRQFLNDYKIRYTETIKCANDWDWLLQIRDNGGYFGVLFEKLFTYSGPRFSAGGIGKCQGEAEAIRKRFSDIQWSEKTDDAYFCDVIEMIQRTPKYERLFTEGYLVFKNKKCLKER
ncbi:MAG: glycosyltransferase, partial [Pseudomonadota bacterium]|nr:glycosyltransferase [Pseudomonadota bacterium]